MGLELALRFDRVEQQQQEREGGTRFEGSLRLDEISEIVIALQEVRLTLRSSFRPDPQYRTDQ